jgi:hypothetical protein
MRPDAGIQFVKVVVRQCKITKRTETDETVWECAATVSIAQLPIFSHTQKCSFSTDPNQPFSPMKSENNRDNISTASFAATGQTHNRWFSVIGNRCKTYRKTKNK